MKNANALERASKEHASIHDVMKKLTTMDDIIHSMAEIMVEEKEMVTHVVHAVDSIVIQGNNNYMETVRNTNTNGVQLT